MKISLLHNAVFFLLFGIMFIFIAIQTAGDSIWNITTILLALVATFDIGVGIQSLRIHFRLKKKKKKD
ncbi:YdiK family protein [Oceanobacillus salinisoli]|uniref:YdiK family protein n=1 Tax=Oceanobacillus salinisoli TaxID=2678611 RepID=UPI0012E2B6BE|nr:YdiK family protein [Oceanobacillus salinisoli]